MNRRQLFTTLLGTAGYHIANAASGGKIAAAEFTRLEGPYSVEAGTADRQYQVTPLHIYDELRPREYHEQGRQA